MYQNDDPRCAADHPSALNFPGGPRSVRYGEGLYVGYRFFQTFDHDLHDPVYIFDSMQIVIKVAGGHPVGVTLFIDG